MLRSMLMPKKAKRKWYWQALLALLGLLLVTALLVSGFEVWRQSAIRHEQDALNTEVAAVRSSFCHEMSFPEHLNSRIKGNNGFEAYKRACSMCGPCAMVEWHRARNVRVGWPAGFPSEQEQTQWLAASDPVAEAIRSAASADVIAYVYLPDSTPHDRGAWDLTGGWHLNCILLARIELLLHRGDAHKAQAELETLFRVNRSLRLLRSLICGIGDFTEIAATLVSRYRLSSDVLLRLLDLWPQTRPLVDFFEEELVYDSWSAEHFYEEIRGDAWFAWVQDEYGSSFDNPLARRWRAASYILEQRQMQRCQIRYLGQCVAAARQGTDLSKGLPEMDEEGAQFPFIREFLQERWGCEHSALRIALALRRAVFKLRLMEFSGPLAAQREAALALREPGVSIRFEEDDCIVSLDAATYPKLPFPYHEENYRLRPLK
jgi:hypothetical protein